MSICAESVLMAMKDSKNKLKKKRKWNKENKEQWKYEKKSNMHVLIVNLISKKLGKGNEVE